MGAMLNYVSSFFTETSRIRRRRADTDSGGGTNSARQEQVKLSGRDSKRVAELLKESPSLNKGLRKAIETKYG